MSADGVTLRVQEDTTEDGETTHVDEQVSFLALEGGAGVLTTGGTAPPPPPDVMGAVRHIDDLTLEPQTVGFGTTLTDPVVFATPVTLAGSDPVTTRITALGGSEVTLQLDEPVYLGDGFHVDETVTVLALEPGEWDLGGGRRLEVGTVAIDNLSSDGFVDVNFAQPFASKAVVVAQIQTDAGPDWVIPRLDAVTTTGFELAMQEEALNSFGHTTETLGWFALETGGFDWNGIGAQAFETLAEVDSGGADFAFAAGVGAAPLLAAGLASFNGGDPANLRLEDLAGGVATFVADEEQSEDAETNHVDEIAAGLAFEGEGLLTGSDLMIA